MIRCEIEIVRYDQEGGVRAVSNRLAASMGELGYAPRVHEVAPPARGRWASLLVNLVPRQYTNFLKRRWFGARGIRGLSSTASRWATPRRICIYAHPDLVRLVPPCRECANVVWYHDSWSAAKENGHALTIQSAEDSFDLLVLLTEDDAASARRDLAMPVVAVRNPAPTLGEGYENISFDSGSNRITRRPKRVTMLTRHDRQKDIALALRAWRASKLAKAGWTLEVYGDGPLRASNGALARMLRLDGVRFHHRTADPIAALLDSRALLCSSRHEGFPSSFLESMTVGTPVISVDSFPACTELLARECGLVVDGRSAHTLAEALDEFGRLTDDELVEMSSACVRRVQGYEGRSVAATWLELLESAVRGRFART